MNLRTEFFVLVALQSAMVSTSAAVCAQSSDVVALQPKRQGAAVNWARDVFPILQRSCLECHGPKKQEAGLRLDQRRAMRESAVVVAGDPDARRLKKQIAAVKKDMEKLTPETTLVMIEQDPPRPAYVFTRGDYRQRGVDVQPGTPAILHPLSAGSPANPPNRLTLAKWLVDPSNPLVARTTVNRWWTEIFGPGLVTTPEDFGIKGEARRIPHCWTLYSNVAHCIRVL